MRTKTAILVPSLHGGGAERVALTIAGHLADCHDVTLVLLEAGQDYDTPDGVAVVRLSAVDGRASRLRKLFAVPIQLWRLRKFLREFRPSVAIALLERPVLYLGLVGPGLGVRLIASFRNHESSHLQNTASPTFKSRIRFAVYRRLLSAAARRFDHLNFLSEGCRRDFLGNFLGHAAERPAHSVIYNGYDVDAIQAQARAAVDSIPADWFASRFTISTMGRIETQKGHVILVHALALVKAQNRVGLIVIGDGALKPQLKAAAAERGLSVADLSDGAPWPTGGDPDVVITGFRRNPHPFIRAASCFAFPSLWEGFGNALVEAMSVGQVVISADCECGPREVLGVPLDADIPPLLEVESGYMVAGSDPQRWAAAIDELMSRSSAELEHRRVAAAARARTFSSVENRKQWRDLVDGLLVNP